MSRFHYFAGEGGAAPARLRPWPPPPRAPLHIDWEDASDRTLPFTPPDKPDVGFMRANFSGISIPGFPILPGMAGYTVPKFRENKAPFCPPIMALDVPRYLAVSRELVAQFFEEYSAIRGFTHFPTFIPQLIEQGFTIDGGLEWLELVRGYIEFNDVWCLDPMAMLGSAEAGRDKDRTFWKPLIKPWLDPIFAAGLVDCGCVGFQLNGWNTGTPRMIEGRMQSPIMSIIDLISEWFAPAGKLLATHWVGELGENGAWNDPYNPQKWWTEEMRGKVQRFYHQGDVQSSKGLFQARMVHSLGVLEGSEAKLCTFENNAQRRFSVLDEWGPWLTEDEGDARAYAALCTKGKTFCTGGYGNGPSRGPDGRTI